MQDHQDQHTPFMREETESQRQKGIIHHHSIFVVEQVG